MFCLWFTNMQTHTYYAYNFNQGQLSILAHACMGGDKEIIVMLLDKLEEDITTYSETDLAHEIYGRPLKVCLDFSNYGCARLLLQRLGVSNTKQIVSFDFMALIYE